MKKFISTLCAFLLAATFFAGCGNDAPSGKVEQLEDLRGKVVYSIGNGSVPDLVFRYILKQNDIEYRFSDKPKDGTVSIAYVLEGSEFIGGLTAGKMNYGVISEPAATVALNKVGGAERLFDIQKLYDGVSGATGGYPQAALVVKKTFLEAHRGYVADFISAFESGSKWAETSPAEALAAIKSAGSSTVPLLTSDIARGCNLGFTRASEVKDKLKGFYNALESVQEEGETPVGAKLPSDDFYMGEISAPAETGVTAKVYAPDGAPAISLAKMIADGYAGAQFKIVQPSIIGASVVGDADIAIMPTNAAAMLSEKAGIVMLGVTNFGSLYLIGG